MTAGFHLQTRDTEGGRMPEAERERSSDWSAGEERERERDLK